MSRHISAEELAERLKAKDKENDRLRRNIRLKDSELAQLQEKCNEKSEKLKALEKRYGAAAAENKQLKRTVETRFPDEMEQGLMEKTLEAAEASHQLERLEEKLKKTSTDRAALREENQKLTKRNEALSQKLHKAIASYERLKRERNSNNKIFLELDDVVTTLNNIPIGGGKDVAIEDENDNVSIKNIRRKIQAIEKDRQRMIKECKNLREENVFKDAKLSSMESKYYDKKETIRPWKTDRKEATDSPQRQKLPLRIEHDDQSESSAGSSTIEPPHISIEVYEQTKREYESTLRQMVKLTETLQKTNASIKGFEQSSKETEERFTELSDEYKEVLLELSNLRRDFNKSETKCHEAIASKDNLKGEYESRLAEMSDAYEYLEENYNKLKDEQNEKLENLEQEVSNSESYFANECKRLKQEHQGNIQALKKEYSNAKEDHRIQMDSEKKRYEDLRLERESVVDSHNRVKEGLARLMEKYDKSLKRIVHLEESIKEEKQNNEQDMLKSSQDSMMRYNKLKNDYNALLLAEKSAGSSASGYRHKLEDHCQTLEETLRENQHAADIRYRELGDCYKSALSTIDELEMKLSEAGETIRREKNQNKTKTKHDIDFDRIADLERDLLSHKGVDVEEPFKSDLPSIQKPEASESQEANFINQTLSDISLEHFCNFLLHQRKVKFVHFDLLHRVQQTEENTDFQSSSFFDDLFLEEGVDISEFKADTSNDLDASTITLSKLLDQLTKMKLLALTASIRYQAREKELKLVFLHYKKVLKEYSSAVSNVSSKSKQAENAIQDASGAKPTLKKEDSSVSTGSTADDSLSEILSTELDEPADPPGEAAMHPEVDKHVEADQVESKDVMPVSMLPGQEEETVVDCEVSTKIVELEENLRAAKSKVDQVTLDTQAAKQKAEEAQEQQEEQEKNLHIMLAKHKELKTEMMSHAQNHGAKNKNLLSQGRSSFDGSYLTSVCESSQTAEVRDEKAPSSKILYDDMTGRYLKLKQEYNFAVEKISIIENELREKKRESELTKSKLETREEELRDVIKRYKELHKEYNGFLNGESIDSNSGLSHAKIIQERDAARWKVSEMQAEIREAKESANAAITKQTLSKQHLRDVIFQYKTLQREHTSLVDRIEGLRGTVPGNRVQTSNPRRNQIQEEKRNLTLADTFPTAIPAPSVSSAANRNLPYQQRSTSQHMMQQSYHGDDTQSVTSFATQSSTSSKKKKFVKELYREVKHNFVRKKANQPFRKGQPVKRISLGGQ